MPKQCFYFRSSSALNCEVKFSMVLTLVFSAMKISIPYIIHESDWCVLICISFYVSILSHLSPICAPNALYMFNYCFVGVLGKSIDPTQHLNQSNFNQSLSGVLSQSTRPIYSMSTIVWDPMIRKIFQILYHRLKRGELLRGPRLV